MNLIELKRYNTLSIYNEILKGKNTINALARELEISNLSVCKLMRNLQRKGIIEISAPPRDYRGRRCFVYTPSHKYYSIFIDKQADAFCVIGISTNGKANIRFDFDINYGGKTAQEVFDSCVLDEIKNSPEYQYCLAIYLCGLNIDEIETDDTVIKTTKGEIIVEAYKDESKIMLFEINGRLILSTYSHVSFPTVTKEALSEAIPIHEVLTFAGELYFETFNALCNISARNLEKII